MTEQQPIMRALATPLDERTDEELRALLAEAETILKTREELRVRDAIADIKKLARENGLTVDVRKARRRSNAKASDKSDAA